MNDQICPQCQSLNVIFSKKNQRWICEDCEYSFQLQKTFIPLRIFISYGHDEYQNFAMEVANRLQQNGHEVWFDTERLKPGGDWENYIEEGIQWVSEHPVNARMLLIMTPHSVRRPDGFCLNEIAMALDKKIFIVPVMLVYATPPLSIYRIQYLDFQHITGKYHIKEDICEHISKIIYALENISYLDQTGYCSRLLHELEPLDFSADLMFHQKWFVGREWVLADIKKWIPQINKQRVFWICGPPGIGKSTITSKIIQNFPEIIAFHLCRKGHSEKISTKRAICSLAYQLCTQIPKYREQLIKMNIGLELQRCNDSALFDILVVQPLSKCHHPPQPYCVLLIDGLDEATINHRNQLASFISTEFEKLPDWLGIIITSRPESEITTRLQQFLPYQIDPQSDKNIHDVETYIDLRLQSISHLDSFPKIKSTLIEKTEGIFLIIRYICEELSQSDSITTQIASLPKGLSAIYFHFFDIKFPNLNEYRQKVRPILRLLISAFEPLKIKELQCQINFSLDEIQDALRSLGALLEIRSDQNIYPFHTSLFEWLANPTQSDFYHINENQGDEAFIQNFHLETASEYLLKHIFKHLNRQGKKVEKRELFLNPDYYKQLAKHFSEDKIIKLFLENHECFTQQERQALFNRESFTHLLFTFNDLLINSGGYHRFNNGLSIAGIEHYLHSEKWYIITISFWYVTEQIEKILDNLDTVKEYNNSSNNLLLHHLVGLSYRRAGQLEMAISYLEQALKIAESMASPNNYALIAADLARIQIFQLDFPYANKILNKATEILQRLEAESPSDSYLIRQLSRAIYYVTLELNLYSTAPDMERCQQLISWFDQLYSNELLIDRYYPRHLYVKLLYLLRKQAPLNALKLTHQKLCDEAHTQYDKMKASLATALTYIQYPQSDIISAIDLANSLQRAASVTKDSSLEKAEIQAVISCIFNPSQPPNIAHNRWAQHFSGIFCRKNSPL